jgi:hypothetical protein
VTDPKNILGQCTRLQDLDDLGNLQAINPRSRVTGVKLDGLQEIVVVHGVLDELFQQLLALSTRSLQLFQPCLHLQETLLYLSLADSLLFQGERLAPDLGAAGSAGNHFHVLSAKLNVCHRFLEGELGGPKDSLHDASGAVCVVPCNSPL